MQLACAKDARADTAAMRAVLFVLLSLITSRAADLKVATLHPLLTDLAQKIGGDRVEVVPLAGKNSDPHHFEPSPQALKETGDAQLFLASGMGMESYLPSLRSVIPATSELVEIGAELPAREGGCDQCEHEHGADHDHQHGTDPHWWHSIDLFRRAASITGAHFKELDPAGSEIYDKNVASYRLELDELERWCRSELAQIPKSNRVLATAHDAFQYFCQDFGFTPLPLAGVNREQMPDAATLAKLISELKEHHVKAIFPEESSNPKILALLSRDLNLSLATPLIADGSTIDTYTEMVRHNITTMVKALK